MGEFYRLNEPQVACEVLEGDLILVHFESGLYYNLRSTGAAVCQHLLAGGGVTAAIENLAAHYGLTAGQVRQDISAFVQQLLDEKLLIPAQARADGHVLSLPAGPYDPPRCEKFDDMADQLLLDKIDDLAQDAQWGPLAGPSL